MREVCLAAALAVAAVFPTVGGVSAAQHDHASMHATHEALPIPPDWTDAQVEAFIAQSDAKIDAWAGRTVPPGETIIYDGLPFTKSRPWMSVAQKKGQCKWCPMKKACH